MGPLLPKCKLQDRDAPFARQALRLLRRIRLRIAVNL